jgi:hypothetical protein
VKYCCKRAAFTIDQLDFIGFYEKPLVKFERLLVTYLAYAPERSQIIPKGPTALAWQKTPFSPRD